MRLHPTNSRRTRAYNIFVGFFFVAVSWAIIAAGAFARGEWTVGQILSENASFALVTVFGLVGAVLYYRRGKQP
jgi:hypothetical protein